MDKPLFQIVVHGEPASKANSRRLVHQRGKMVPIKSAKAMGYARDFCAQVPILPRLIEGELRCDIRIFYASRRPDLDESLILDLLQGRVYANDRQVRERHVYHDLDRSDPRATIAIYRRAPTLG